LKSAAPRLRRFRERRRAGKAVLSIEVNLFDHIEMLKDAGLLKEWDESDRTAIADATERLLRLAAEDSETRFQSADFRRRIVATKSEIDYDHSPTHRRS
jgi:hypothetical protein